MNFNEYERIVSAASAKNIKMTKDPSTKLHKIVLQRQLWNKLSSTPAYMPFGFNNNNYDTILAFIVL